MKTPAAAAEKMGSKGALDWKGFCHKWQKLRESYWRGGQGDERKQNQPDWKRADGHCHCVCQEGKQKGKLKGKRESGKKRESLESWTTRK